MKTDVRSREYVSVHARYMSERERQMCGTGGTLLFSLQGGRGGGGGADTPDRVLCLAVT